MKHYLDLYDLSFEDKKDLCQYCSPRFHSWHQKNEQDDDYLLKWIPIMIMAQEDVPKAIHTYLLKPPSKICFEDPESLKIEIYKSFAGEIPVISTNNVHDFEEMLKKIIYHREDIQHIEEIGASFAYGENNRFILLSGKPYSHISARQTEFTETEWAEKSMIIRREHESTHYYTKLHYGTSKNHIHDELIADFNGMMAAMNKYSAEYFLKFMGLSDDSDGMSGRLKVYTQNLSSTAVDVISYLLIQCAQQLEQWSQTNRCLHMSVEERTKILCQQDLFDLSLGIMKEEIF